MNLTTKYMGLTLKNPIVPSSSPLSKKLDRIQEMEECGASAVVLYSIFEEQLTHEAAELHYHTTIHSESYAEALSYFPETTEYNLGPDEYLEHIRKAKELVQIPVIASLNGVTTGGWIDYAKKMEQAGADAIELNVYMLAADTEQNGAYIEQVYIDILKAVKSVVKIPVAIKLSPYFSSVANMAKRLDDAGADGLVLFNRFYQPDIDLETLDIVPNVVLSTSSSMRLPLRWVAILAGRVKADIAASSGIHSAEDIIKMTMAGASVTQMFSALRNKGITHITSLLNDLQVWMEKHEYESLDQMRGSMSHKKVANPSAFERANYMKSLNSYK